MTGITDNNNRICENCGYQDGTPNLDACLSPKTFLANRFVVGKVISYNGEGILYLGYDTELKMRVTIKEFMPDTLCTRHKDEEFVNVRLDRIALYKTYLAEFTELHKTLKKAKSSEPQLAIQNIIEVFTEFDTAYAVFEYIEGENLKTALAGENGKICKIKWDSTKSLFSPVLYTINVLNEHGIIHRAINPSTLIIEESGNLRIISFGITAARTYGSAINYEVFSGYAAPEQYDKAAKQGSQTDVYGISAVLYAVLTGTVPNDAISRAANDETVNPFLINPKIPINASKVIMQGLALKSNMRIQTAAILAERLWENETPVPPDDVLLVQKPLKPATEKQEIQKDENEPKEYTENKRTIQTFRDKLSEKVTILKKLGENDFKAIFICAIIAVVLIGTIAVISYTATHSKKPYNPPKTTYAAEEVTFEETAATSSKVSESKPQTDTPAPETVFVVPDFNNRIYNQSFQQNYNLIKFKINYRYSSSVPQNMIFGQSVPPQTEVKAGTEITLKVSRGPSVIPLPDYTGKTLKEYLAILSNAGIQFETEEIQDDTVPANTVISCSFEIGAPVTIAVEQDDPDDTGDTGDIGDTGPAVTSSDNPVTDDVPKIDVVTVYYTKENFHKITAASSEEEEAAEEETT
jgi:serine/threonine-protein kinase